MSHLLRLFGFSLLFCGLFAATHTYAQGVRIAVVDPERISREANTAGATRAKLQQEFAVREKNLIDQGTALKTLVDNYEREAPTLSESQRAARQKQLADNDREFQQGRRRLQEDLDARTGEEMQRLMERANLVVKQVAETEKYDLVLQQAVYVNPKNDITSKVIQILNSGAPK